MSGVAGSRLAVACDSLLEAWVKSASQAIRCCSTKHILPVGAGFIVFGTPLDEFLPVIARHNPAVAWLSFGTAAEFQEWAAGIRQCSPQTKIWIQLGSVTAAVEAARRCQPDALVLQGSDAGGHGHESGASIVSLIPEVADALRAKMLPDIPLIAAGGIMDGRGTAAALALGASGVVMGTRFLGAEEASVPSSFRNAILEASDGGEATARSRAFDAMWGHNMWPPLYDGRCLKNTTYQRVKDGMSHDEARLALYRDLEGRTDQQVSAKDSMTIWAGTGVGMVNKVERAADIVCQVRTSALETIAALGTAMGGRGGLIGNLP
ncbi:hypothetical protein CHGG_10736 [Chaetomium globosum CBS 148.51]|uniref:Uncharacterized protein n=1 Tax=Chaetomium globosum (strain ATCC 6205 / CBS 148.51 / DSM 1962 / NBRC 6347 / NRRL 1970) TaxID=306901 RepID=Q2GMR8_CHAGB|nr:uncharacterized protein CHGG_10736 [Chaetomium globosum CBS 148.51]EAQ82918.1 hypothetical protein CHGG_10736 [Chaetomium globosum CBS 148.51]